MEERKSCFLLMFISILLGLILLFSLHQFYSGGNSHGRSGVSWKFVCNKQNLGWWISRYTPVEVFE